MSVLDELHALQGKAPVDDGAKVYSEIIHRGRKPQKGDAALLGRLMYQMSLTDDDVRKDLAAVSHDEQLHAKREQRDGRRPPLVAAVEKAEKELQGRKDFERAEGAAGRGVPYYSSHVPKFQKAVEDARRELRDFDHAGQRIDSEIFQHRERHPRVFHPDRPPATPEAAMIHGARPVCGTHVNTAAYLQGAR